MVSQSVTIDVAGQSMPAYLARPDDEHGKQRPAVIVLQEIFGVNAEIKRVTDLVAGAGYVGLAINFFHRTDPDLDLPYTQEGREQGMAATAKITRDGLRADVRAAMEWLNAQDYVAFNHIATWGFCFGGTVAFLTATLDGIDAAICFYGSGIANPQVEGRPGLDDAGAIEAPLLLVYGGKDGSTPPEAIERTRAALTAAHVRFDVQIYPEQGHAFFRGGADLLDDDSRDDETPHDVSDAWDRVQAFLEEHLR